MKLLRSINTKKIATKTESKKFDLKTLVWFGFNYTCGMAFPLAFSTIIYGKELSGIGLWIFLVLILGSLLAAIMGYAYSKMAKVYIKSNGASYAYVRASFGRFWGWIIGILQYVSLPIATASYFVFFISVNLSEFVNWGRHEYLYLNLIGVLIYIAAASSIFLGLKYFKLFISLSGVIKWTSIIFIVICALALDGLNHFSGFSYAIKQTKVVTKHNFFSDLNNSFISIFYFYAGFETYTTIAKNVKNPAKTMPRSILIITTLTLLFYIVITICFIGVQPDPNAESWFTKNPPLDITRMAAGLLGAILVIASMISLKINVAMQNSLYASAMLEPLALENYISPSFSKLNKDRISVSSALFNIVLTTGLMLVLILLPSIILYKQDNPSIDYTQLVGFTTIITFVQYLLVLCALFHLYLKKMILLLKVEKIAFSFIFLFLIFELGSYFYQQVILILNNLNDISGLFALISIIIFIMLFVIASILYKFYYLPIYKRRLKINPQLQRNLDNAFVISEYAKLEINLYEQKVITIKNLKNNKKAESNSFSKQEIKDQKNKYKKAKNNYLNNFKQELITLKSEYKANIKAVNNPKDNFEIIKDLYDNYIKAVDALKNQKVSDLFILKEETISLFAINNKYIKNKHNLIKGIHLQLEECINNSASED